MDLDVCMPPSIAFPAIEELLKASAPPLDDDNGYSYVIHQAAEDAAQRRPADLSARNEDCPFCDEAVAVLDKPVAVLPCGHAYHVLCGRSLLFRGEGSECTVGSCHRSTEAVEQDKMRGLIEAAVRRNEFTMADLSDPIVSRDILQGLQAKMQVIQRAGDAQVTAMKKAKASAAAEDRSLDAYRARWERTAVGRDGLTAKQKAFILLPYTKNIVRSARERDLSLTTLYDHEDVLRRAAQDDSKDSEAEGGSGTAAPLVSVEKSASLANRISVKRFMDAGLTIADLFFKMELQTWQGLVDLGFKKEYITHREGRYPITAVVDLYGVDYTALKEDLGWGVDDVARVQISAQDLANIGLDFQKLYVDMRMNKGDMPSLRFSPKDWHDTLGLDKKYLFAPLNFTALDLQLLRWKPQEFIAAFAINRIEEREMNIDRYSTRRVGAAAPAPVQQSHARPGPPPPAVQRLPALQREAPSRNEQTRRPPTILRLNNRAAPP